MLAAAVFLLLAFEHIQFKAAVTKVIAFLSPLAFSVYLIHEQEQIKNNFIVNNFIWIAKLPTYQMILLVIGAVISIYVLCSGIDLIRHYLFKALKLKERLNNLENRLKVRFSKNNYE